MCSLLVLRLHRVDETNEHSTTHVLQIDVQKRIVEALGKVGNGLAQVAVAQLLPHVVNVVGDYAASACAHRLRSCVTRTAKGCVVKELVDVGKKF